MNEQTLEIAKAMISGIASAASFIVGGAAFVIGASIQGLTNIGKWISKKGKAAYAKVSTAANELYTAFCKGFAKVAKSSVQAFTAFMTGVKAVAYTATGIALAAFKSVASLLDPAVKKIFVEKDQTLAWLIPIAIVIAFATKGLSLYFVDRAPIASNKLVIPQCSASPPPAITR